MRKLPITLLVALLAVPLLAQSSSSAGPPGPTNPKAKKTFKDAQTYERRGDLQMTLYSYRKADQQDGGRCVACQDKIIKEAVSVQDWKSALKAAEEQVAEASPGAKLALADDQVAQILDLEVMRKSHPKPAAFAPIHLALLQALAAYPNYPDAILLDGEVLARMNQPAAARDEFNKLVQLEPAANVDRQRAERYLADFSLVTARMAPPFAVTTMDGRRVSLDDLKGKVVLLDFWATWCEPCREALPHMKKIAAEFKGAPFVMLSVSLDQKKKPWRAYIEKNGMDWLNTYDGYWHGPMATLFGVQAIPQTFTIDAHGVLQDQKIGDLSIDGKLKKLIAQAEQLQSAAATRPAAVQ